MNQKQLSGKILSVPIAITALVILIAIGGYLAYAIYQSKQVAKVVTPELSESSDEESSGISDKPTTKETCLAKGGTWGKIGIFSNEETCNLPTTDSNKECQDNDECQGECIAENRQSVVGKCNNRQINIGCRYFMEDGKASQICSD